MPIPFGYRISVSGLRNPACTLRPSKRQYLRIYPNQSLRFITPFTGNILYNRYGVRPDPKKTAVQELAETNRTIPCKQIHPYNPYCPDDPELDMEY